ncbi:nucleotide-diphospho-sugar transferase [Aspergillus pseudonomiae]|uniref:Nucleotide-diphospho-sugar transferase n=1 Tax=Aspergillus pseudonomiae TaxID=1506151 RepID=A0A5N7CZ16_9EURO|nr:nucleotide-diphospho-sugar transferase [Aspergillus pseudonomiae]KAB8255369.1 nucleotide-diphospho-sugar transferase [Aspergillus pseudonomiae]KAE8398823.1 nucleotide-diphospho-sugar transferase [Aspergillus pseudonomiae]
MPQLLRQNVVPSQNHRCGLPGRFLAAFCLLSAHYFWHKEPPNLVRPLQERRSRLWQHLHPLLKKYVPDCPKPIQNGSPGLPRFDAIHETPRQNLLTNVDEILQPMQSAHDGVVQAIQNFDIGDAFVPGTVGIVSSAGGTYLPTFVVSLSLLRRTGSTLPVELFMKDRTEYEGHICEVVLPQLGAKCLVLSEILADGNETKSIQPIEGFQIKSFAMLFSSFEKFLWLDADCVPLHDPMALLQSEPFPSTGLVTWPATKAGVILVSKSTHTRSLLLAAYYNYYGPNYYYSLLGQGAPGAGDKDTFLHAATALNQSFYAVGETVVDLGNLKPGNPQAAINAGYVQADPIQDYDLTSQGKWRVRDPSVAKPPRVYFIHAGAPEFNPGKELLGPKLQGFDGSPTRLWTYPPEAMRRLGFDAERIFWEETMSVACTMESAFETWNSKSGLCDTVRAHWKAVFENPDIKVPRLTDS